MTNASPTTPAIAVALMTLFAAPASAYEETATVADAGKIAGQVVFHGTVPTKQIIPNKDVDVCGGSREDPLLEMGQGDGVANTLVYLADVSKGKPWGAMPQQPEMANAKCRFRPSMQVIKPGPIDIVNTDPVLHNTHGYYGRRTAFNTALPNQDQRITVELMKTGTVRVDCDAHGWMEGWVFVRDNPYYAFTGPDGKFAIGDVPPGNYTVVVLQPYSALIEQPVTVASGKTVDLSFTLKPTPQ